MLVFPVSQNWCSNSRTGHGIVLTPWSVSLLCAKAHPLSHSRFLSIQNVFFNALCKEVCSGYSSFVREFPQHPLFRLTERIDNPIISNSPINFIILESSPNSSFNFGKPARTHRQMPQMFPGKNFLPARRRPCMSLYLTFHLPVYVHLKLLFLPVRYTSPSQSLSPDRLVQTEVLPSRKIFNSSGRLSHSHSVSPQITILFCIPHSKSGNRKTYQITWSAIPFSWKVSYTSTAMRI
mgnify:CR=1 FL=1